MKQLTPALLWQSLQGLLQSSGRATPPLVVGLSGGVDSLVLLHALSCLVSTDAKNNPQIKLRAIHVNHQLQTQANDWQAFCLSFCEKYNIPIQCIAVDAAPTQGEGPEAAARNARYAAFKLHLNKDDILLTGHHLDDQIETVFLQMLRGTGVNGAAGIRPLSVFNTDSKSTYLVRPMLMFNREQIEAYANANNLKWIDDPSNQQTHYDRNFIRHEMLPVIEKRWPAYRQTINRFSQNLREASELLKEIAALDFDGISAEEKKVIDILSLTKFSLPRMNNVLRYWIEKNAFPAPSEKQLVQIHAVIAAQSDSEPLVCWGDAQVRRFKNKLYLMRRNAETIDASTIVNIENWQLGQQVTVPGYGVLELQASTNAGIKENYFSSQNIQIKFRQGGEKCKPVGRDKTQLLKKIFQEKNIPPWRRMHAPLLFINDEIAAVVGHFYCAPFANASEEGFIVVKVSD